MKIGNFEIKRAKPKSGGIQFPKRYQQMFLSRVGINVYDDDSRTYIEKGYQQNPIVYSIVNMVAKNAGRVKWCIKNKATGMEVSVPLLEELMKGPNPLQSWTDLTQDALTHKLLEGNTFITGEFGSGVNAGKFNSLYVLPTEEIQIIADASGRGLTGYRVDRSWAESDIIPATDVLHIKNPNPDFDEIDNWLYGQSNFRAASQSIQTYNESLETGVWFLQNKGVQKAVFTKDPEVELGPEGADALKDKLRAQGQGPKNSANIPIIDEELGVIDLSSDPAQALVLEQRAQAAMEICNVTNFPPALIGLNDATYQNAKEAKKALWENIILPELHELKEGYNRWLTPQFGDNIYLDFKVDHIDALQEDNLMRGKAIKEFAGMVTINEARQMAGLMPIQTLGDFNGDDMYLGFTQAVVQDQEEISDANNNDDGEDETSN